MSTTTTDHSHELAAQPPWLSWLPHGVQFVTDEQGRVCALRSLKGATALDLELGAVIVRTQRDTPSPGTIEWTVHASVSRHSNEAKAALALVQCTLVMLKGLQKDLVEEVAKSTVAPARRRDLIERERSILVLVAAAFLLVDPLAHPQLATLYHPKIVRLVRRMPDMHGRLNLPAPGR